MERFPFMLPVFCGVPQESVQGIPDFFYHVQYNPGKIKCHVEKKVFAGPLKTKYIPGFISL